jgi:hypothetical protein
LTDTAIVTTDSEALQTAHMLREWADMVVENVSTQTNERLVELARDAQYLEKAAFRVRGACGAELKKRIRERQLEDPENPGPKVGQQMKELAQQIGVASKTLEDDTRIYETFSDGMTSDRVLDREHYRVALSAPDPKAAIELAYEQKEADSDYSTREFRQEIKRLRGVENNGNESTARRSSLRLDDDTLELLAELRELDEYRGKSNELIVMHAVMHFYREKLNG